MKQKLHIYANFKAFLLIFLILINSMKQDVSYSRRDSVSKAGKTKPKADCLGSD